MRLLSRRIAVDKTDAEVYRVIKSCAYRFHEGTISENKFSIYCAKRYKGSVISLIPIKGTIEQHEHRIEVNFSMCADAGFYLGVLVSLLGIIGLLWCLISFSTRWIPSVGMILFGLLLSGQSLREGAALLDRLEHKLLI